MRRIGCFRSFVFLPLAAFPFLTIVNWGNCVAPIENHPYCYGLGQIYVITYNIASFFL